ncbi:hypothetical protein EZS27_034918 [termite gut metagenome]|uniref:Core-binding (CB) domain-containing protein n=1 Tax=termite gut metagenome TaxID=433724 RepID=A0A5J4Q0D3_9ZZZZ
MATTLHFTTVKSRQNSKGKYPIYIAVFHKRDVRYITTEYEIDDLFQFENGKVVCRKDAKIMNQRLEYVLSTYIEKLDKIKNKHVYSCSQIKNILQKEQEIEEKQLITIKEAMSERISRLEKEKRDGTAEQYAFTLKRILNIIGDVTLESISPVTVKKLIEGMERKKLSNATINTSLAHLKACINEAIDDGFVKYELNPFTKVKGLKPNIRRIDITPEEFNKIKNYQPNEKGLVLAKDLFLLSFYLGGINLVDLLKVELHGDTLSYVRQKTENKSNHSITFNIPEEAKPLIRK